MPEYPRVMVTGHRPQFLSDAEGAFVHDELYRVAEKLRDRSGMQVGISGMALGADTDWAWATLTVHAELWSFLPFPQQASKWLARDVDTWNYLRSRAKQEVVAEQKYSVAALHRRNDLMLDNADLVVAVWKPAKTEGGTVSAVRKAVARGLPMIHVDPAARSTMMTMNPGV